MSGTKLFNSKDFIEDARESLEKGGFPYVLFVGVAESVTAIYDNVKPEGREMFLEWIRDGFVEKCFADHVRRKNEGGL